MSIRVLIADDDADFLAVAAYALGRAGFAVKAVPSGATALDCYSAENPDIVLVDFAMPDASGLQVCEKITSTSSTPVIVLSESKSEADIVRAFDVGADEFLFKPLSFQHLVRLIRAIHRRTSGHKTAEQAVPSHVVRGPLVIDLDSFAVFIEDQSVRLTQLELRILHYLVMNAGRVVPTDRLIDVAWGYDSEADASLLKTHISHIRRKLHEASEWPVVIKAIPSVGYSLQDPAA